MEALFLVVVSPKADERNAFNAASPLRYGHVLKKRYQANIRYQYSNMFQLGIHIRSNETSGDGAIETTSATQSEQLVKLRARYVFDDVLEDFCRKDVECSLGRK